MDIRYAVIEDLQKIIDIYNSTIAGKVVTADLEPVTIKDRLEWFYEHNHEKRPLWVMEDSGEVIGWLSFQSFYGRPAYNSTVEMSIYLKEECRGRGLGEKFINYAFGECKRCGIKTVLGFIFSHNTSSMKLVKKVGFDIWGTLPGIADMGDAERDLVIVGKRVIQG